MAKINKLSAGAIEVLANVKETYGKEKTFTIAELKANGVNVNPAQVMKFIRDGLATVDGQVIVNKRVVNAYKLTDAGFAYGDAEDKE